MCKPNYVNEMKSYCILGIILGRKVLQITFFSIVHEKVFMIQPISTVFLSFLRYYIYIVKGKWKNTCIATSISKLYHLLLQLVMVYHFSLAKVVWWGVYGTDLTMSAWLVASRCIAPCYWQCSKERQIANRECIQFMISTGSPYGNRISIFLHVNKIRK